MESIYLVSNPKHVKRNEYKMGRHQGSKRKLESRYATYLIDPTIYYFKQVNASQQIEHILKHKLKPFRITSKNGRKLEWIKLDLETIINEFDQIIKNYDSPNMIQVNYNEKQHSYIDLIRSAMIIISELNVFNIYDHISADFIFCTRIEPPIIYKYNEFTQLYEKIILPILGNIIQTALLLPIQLYFDRIQQNENDKKCIAELLGKIGENIFINQVAKTACIKYYRPDFQHTLDSKHDVINFKNGIVSLRDGLFRPRNHRDFYTRSLDYDYVPVNTIIQKKMRIINHIYLKECNDDSNDREGMKQWHAYCMTGDTNQQKIFISINYSSLFEIFSKTFPIYCTKMNRKIFSEKFDGKHKHFQELVGIRYLHIEGFDNKIAEIGGNIINEDIICKLHISTTCNPKIVSNKTCLRNFFMLRHNPISDNDIFKSSEYKIALFHLLLPYAIDYYSDQYVKINEIYSYNNPGSSFHGIIYKCIFAVSKVTPKLSYCQKFEKAWLRECIEKDNMRTFVDDLYEKTNNDDDRIHKDDFLSRYQTYFSLKNITWNTLLPDIKRIGLTYNYSLRHPDYSTRGVITGLKFIEEEKRCEGSSKNIIEKSQEEDDSYSIELEDSNIE